MKLTRTHKIVIIAYIAINELIDKGFIQGPKAKISREAIRSVRGFKQYSQDDINQAAHAILTNGGITPLKFIREVRH
jgi:hypothetical protein